MRFGHQPSSGHPLLKLSPTTMAWTPCTSSRMEHAREILQYSITNDTISLLGYHDSLVDAGTSVSHPDGFSTSLEATCIPTRFTGGLQIIRVWSRIARVSPDSQTFSLPPSSGAKILRIFSSLVEPGEETRSSGDY